MSNIIAIVGRPNVGKSTLFNRLIQRREAIVDSVSGVTRDRHYGKGDWNGKEFSVIDTGGYVVGSDDVFESEIDHQVELAIDEADVILFMVDVDSGITSMDSEISDLLRKVDKPVFLVVNKVDNSSRINDINEFERNSGGSTSMYFACKQGAKNIYLLGFDLATVGKSLSNVHLLPDYNKGFDSTIWQNQMKTVMRKFKNVNFYWVSQEEHKDKFQGISNLEFVTIEDLNKWIDQTE